jgi:hypothetical protein
LFLEAAFVHRLALSGRRREGDGATMHPYRETNGNASD